MTLFGITITWSWLISLVIGFLGISVMIIVHELGHRFMALACGINVESMRFGMGPAIVKFTPKETTYLFCLIPFGGACRMTGSDDLKSALRQKKKCIESAEDGSIWSVSPLKRTLTYLAGPVANVLFAFLCYAILMSIPSVVNHSPARVALSNDYSSIYGVTETAASRAGMQTGDLVLSVDGHEVDSYALMQALLSEAKDNESVEIVTERGTFTVHPVDGIFGFLPFREPVVGHVMPDTPEKKAGLKAGDRIIEINGRAVSNMMDLLEASSSDDWIEMVVDRGGTEVSIAFENPSTGLNFTLKQETITIAGQNFFRAFLGASREVFSIFSQSISSLLNMFRRQSSVGQTLSGTFSASQSIGMLTTQSFSQGFNSGIRTMLYLLACVSISLCVMNLLPIPALDGGQIIVCLAELVTRRTFNPKFYLVLQIVGMLMIGGAILLITFM